MRNARNFRPLVLRTSVQQKLKFTEKMISCGWKTWLQGQECFNNILPPPLLCFYWVLTFSISLSLCIACNSLFKAVSCTWRIAQVRWMLEDQIKQHHINRWTTTALVISNTYDTSIYKLGTRWVDEDKKVSCKQNVQWILLPPFQNRWPNFVLKLVQSWVIYFGTEGVLACVVYTVELVAAQQGTCILSPN